MSGVEFINNNNAEEAEEEEFEYEDVEIGDEEGEDTERHPVKFTANTTKPNTNPNINPNFKNENNELLKGNHENEEELEDCEEYEEIEVEEEIELSDHDKPKDSKKERKEGNFENKRSGDFKGVADVSFHKSTPGKDSPSKNDRSQNKDREISQSSTEKNILSNIKTIQPKNSKDNVLINNPTRDIRSDLQDIQNTSGSQPQAPKTKISSNDLSNPIKKSEVKPKIDNISNLVFLIIF